MKNIFLIASIILAVSSCKNKNVYGTIEYDGQYVRLISKEKTEWIIQFYCLNSVTPASPENLNLGLKERMDILNRKVILKNSVIESFDCGPFFELPDSLDNYQDFIDSVKNNDNIRISSLSYSQKGIYINELISKGYMVTFAEEEGEFYVSRKKEKQ